MAQAETLTNDQIDAIYNHYEHGEARPRGVVMKGSYIATMGRHTMSDENGTYLVNL